MPALRVFIVLALSLAIVGVASTDLTRMWTPIGVFGYGTDLDGVVTGVTPGSPADKAGLRIGDRLDKASMDPQQLEDLIQIPGVSSAGVSRTFGVFHDGSRRVMTLVSASEPMNAGVETLIVLGVLATILCVAIGAVTLLLRPEPSTWAFFIVCLAYAPYSVGGLFGILTAPYIQYAQFAFGVLQSAGQAAFLIFAIYLLRQSADGWRRVALWVAPVIFATLSVLAITEVVDTYFLGTKAQWIGQVRLALWAACDTIAIASLVDTDRHQHGADRQRIRWIVVGVAIMLAARLADYIVTIEYTNTSEAIQSALLLVQVVGPIAIAYAIVRHRVIDINFVVSRTLVYGILTAFFVGLFALVDWFVGHVLDQTRWATVAEIGVAIAVGFWLNGLHARVDQIVDRVLFRQRHLAELRLERLARGLPHATSIEAVDAALVSEATDALDLTMGALFKADGRDRLARRVAVHWPPLSVDALQTSDPLILHLQAERGPLRLAELHWPGSADHAAATRPVLAVPIIVRHELEAVVLFGGHRGGEEFDPDELRWLSSLATASGAAYDHLEADALREENARVKRELEAQRAASSRP